MREYQRIRREFWAMKEREALRLEILENSNLVKFPEILKSRRG